MVKTKRKITALRVLQILFYALGFPLFLHLVMLVSRPISGSNLVTGLNGKMSIIIAAAMWLVVVLAQLLLRAICRKNRVTRAVIAALVAAVVTIAPIAYSDILLKAKYEDEVATAQEEDENRWFDSYEVQITKYGEYVDSTNYEINAFLSTFNIDFYSKNYNAGGANTDHSDVTWDEENDIAYSPNGMFADGYRFSYYAAKQVLTDYYKNKYAFEAEGKDIDEELEKELAKLEKSGSNWDKYKKGTLTSADMEGFEYVSSSDEYKLAYGPDGTATKYYLTEERLNAILSLVGEKFGNLPAINGLLTLVGTLVTLPPEVGDITDLLNADLSIDKILNLVNSIDIDGQSLGQLLMGLLGEEGATELNKEVLFELLKNFSYYQSPTTYPVYYFIEDAALRDYAYAKYYATVHGAKIGSVLVGDKVGEITMSASGTINPYSGWDLLNMFDRWDFAQKMQNEYYPIFAVRQIALKMSAAIVFTLLAAYFFTGLIDKQYAKLTLKK